jgi:hypothetical protein
VVAVGGVFLPAEASMLKSRVKNCIILFFFSFDQVELLRRYLQTMFTNASLSMPSPCLFLFPTVYAVIFLLLPDARCNSTTAATYNHFKKSSVKMHVPGSGYYLCNKRKKQGEKKKMIVN